MLRFYPNFYEYEMLIEREAKFAYFHYCDFFK